MKNYNRCETPNGEWGYDKCRELCKNAGMMEEFESADAETFESVVYKAAEKLGVDIFS